MKKNSFLIFMMLISTISLISCDRILDEGFDCIINTRPTIELERLPTARQYVDYSIDITTAIRHDSDPDIYNYAYEIEGDLPPGLSVNHELGSRTLNISGMPVETGVFTLKLKVIVTEPESYLDYEQSEERYDDGDDGDDGDNFCSNYDEREYLLEVVSY